MTSSCRPLTIVSSVETHPTVYFSYVHGPKCIREHLIPAEVLFLGRSVFNEKQIVI